MTAQTITAGDPWKPGPDPWGVSESDLDDDGSGPDSQLHEGDWDDAVSEATS